MIRARGFSVETTPEAGRLGSSDVEQLAYTVRQRKTFLTHNRVDFEVLARNYFTAGQGHYGIILAVRRPPRELARRLLRVLNDLTADEMENQLRYI